jgi:hypothetical protein
MKKLFLIGLLFFLLFSCATITENKKTNINTNNTNQAFILFYSEQTGQTTPIKLEYNYKYYTNGFIIFECAEGEKAFNLKCILLIQTAAKSELKFEYEEQ